MSGTIKKWIEVNYKFRGVHCWKDCPIDIVDFLKYPHHHEFEITVRYAVEESDRQLEFIVEQLVLETVIHNIFPNYNLNKTAVEVLLQEVYKKHNCDHYNFIPYTADFSGYSCESICETILGWLKEIHPKTDISLKLSEDGHYGGEIDYTYIEPAKPLELIYDEKESK